MKCPNCNYEIKKSAKNRSNQQNDWFHGQIIPILAEYTGYSFEEMKGIVKFKFGIVSTSSLDTAEFSIFTDKVRNWAAEMGCYIPSPNEYPVIV